MKLRTALLVGVTILQAGVANAQYYGQPSVSGYVVSQGPEGFVLRGPDGNYGIYVTQGTVFSDPWSNSVTTGSSTVQVGQYVTATGSPTGQWTMRASAIVGSGGGYPVGGYGGDYYGGGYPVYSGVNGTGAFVNPNSVFPNISNLNGSGTSIRSSVMPSVLSSVAARISRR